MDSGGLLVAPLVLLFVLFFFNTVNNQQGRFRDSHLKLVTKVHLALIPNAHQKKWKGRSKKGKKDLRNQNTEERKTFCVYIMKCWLFSCGLLFCRCFIVVFIVCNISVKKQWPLLCPHLSTISLMNWHTPKHLGLLLCTGPLLLLYNFSADACTIYTVYNILKQVIMALRVNLMSPKQLWFSASVVHQQPELCSSLFVSVLSSFSLTDVRPKHLFFSDQNFNSRGESPKGLSLFTFWFT